MNGRGVRWWAGVVLGVVLGCTAAGAVDTAAQSAILMDAAGGRVLFAQAEDTPRPIASVTKLMTALVCAESYEDLDQPVLIAPEAAGIEGSSLYLKPMEKFTVRQLLYGLLLHSGNDAAVALAMDCGGTEENFVAAMNQKARALGMTNTHFANPHGLDAEDHYSTARDLAILAGAVLKNPDLAAICATKNYAFGDQTLTNHNKLLWRYDGCVGLKTGYTQTAGRTLVSAATRSEGTLIAVTLDDPEDWADHAALLDYGFSRFQAYPLCRSGKVLFRLPVEGAALPYVPVTAAEDLEYMLAENENVTVQFHLPEQIAAPVKAGDILGSVTYRINGEKIAQTYLTAAGDVPAASRSTWARYLQDTALARGLFARAPVWRGMLTRSP